MSIQADIEQKLRSALEPAYLDVLDESHKHNVPPGSESHFKVTVVSEAFDGRKLVDRHRMVNGILAGELQTIHALALHTYTPEEWVERGHAPPNSPPCQGGGKQQ